VAALPALRPHRRQHDRAGGGRKPSSETREGTRHPDRDAQFHYIDNQVMKALAAGAPAIFVDAKKEELAGGFENAGRERRSHGPASPRCSRVRVSRDVALAAGPASRASSPSAVKRSRHLRTVLGSTPKPAATEATLHPAASRGAMAIMAAKDVIVKKHVERGRE